MDREKDLPLCANYAFCGNKISWRSSRQQNAEIRICAGSLECKRFQQRTNRSRKIKAKNAKINRLEEENKAIKSVLNNTADENISKQALACNVLQTLSSNLLISNAVKLKTQDDDTKLVLDLPVASDNIKTQFLCVRAKSDAFTFILNYLERNKNAMFEKFFPISHLGLIAAYSSLPNLVSDVMSSKIVQLPDKVKILFCSSGDSETYASTVLEPLKKKKKTTKETDKNPGFMSMAQLALDNTPFFNQYAPTDNECLRHHLAGRIESCKVGLLSVFIQQRGTTPSLLEMAFARKDCVVLWGMPKFDSPRVLPSYTKIKKLSKYTKKELLNELKAQKISPTQITRLTSNQARIGFLDGKSFDSKNRFQPCVEIVESEQICMNEFDINSICLPGAWIYSDVGKAFIAPYIK